MDTAKAPEERVVTETSTATEGEAEAEAVPAEADAATTEAPTAPADDVDGGDEGMVAGECGNQGAAGVVQDPF
eukprot:m.327756 g.327756  ORF g.327756 m.327756 type:complete len:73 (+) comp19749_c0_seq1:132-350(+)